MSHCRPVHGQVVKCVSGDLEESKSKIHHWTSTRMNQRFCNSAFAETSHLLFVLDRWSSGTTANLMGVTCLPNRCGSLFPNLRCVPVMDRPHSRTFDANIETGNPWHLWAKNALRRDRRFVRSPSTGPWHVCQAGCPIDPEATRRRGR